MKEYLGILVCALSIFSLHIQAFAGRISPEFRPYVARFVAERARLTNANVYPFVLSVDRQEKFPKDAPEGAVGYCEMDEWKIHVLGSEWDSHDDAWREQLIFHEMGHCVLGLDHDRCPSIMCACLSPSPEYIKNREKWLRYLFQLEKWTTYYGI